jgi:hypothetical protein
MSFRPFRLPALLMALAAALAAGCSPAVDLEDDIELVDVQTGYFDNGLKDGRNHMLPHLAFRIRNVSDHDVSSVLLTVSFWIADPAGHAAAVAAAQASGAEPPEAMTLKEISSAQVRGVTSDGLAPGEETAPIVVRPDVGYTLEGPRADFFVHSEFLDVTARVFARRGGAIVQIGEYVLDQRIIQPSGTPDGQ